MMIKNFLKRNGITLTQFAADLNISRPTLDIYIKNYDEDFELSNQLFQKIFDFLFQDQNVSKNDFLSKYEYVKSYYGKKDESLSSLHLKSTSTEDIEKNEYDSICDEIVSLIEKSKNNTRLSLDKIKKVRNLLIEDLPDFEVVWEEGKSAIIRLKNYNKYFLCVVLGKEEPDAFKPWDVYFAGDSKYCKVMEDESSEYLIGIAQSVKIG